MSIFVVNYSICIYDKDYHSKFSISIIPFLALTYLIEYLFLKLEVSFVTIIWYPMLVIIVSSLICSLLSIFFFAKSINKLLVRKCFKQAIKDFPDKKEILEKEMKVWEDKADSHFIFKFGKK